MKTMEILENLKSGERFGTLDTLKTILLEDTIMLKHLPIYLSIGDDGDSEKPPSKFLTPLPFSEDDLKSARKFLEGTNPDHIMLDDGRIFNPLDHTDDAMLRGIIMAKVAQRIASELPLVFSRFEIILDSFATEFDLATGSKSVRSDALIAFYFSLDTQSKISMTVQEYGYNDDKTVFLKGNKIVDVNSKDMDEFLIKGAIVGYKTALLKRMMK